MVVPDKRTRGRRCPREERQAHIHLRGYVFHTKYQDMPREWESWTSDGYVYTMMNTLRDLMVPLFPLYMIDKKLVDPELPIKQHLLVLRKYEKRSRYLIHLDYKCRNKYTYLI